MSRIVNQSLQTITKGAAIIFLGLCARMLLALVGRIILVRYITKGEYGLYSLGLVALEVIITLSCLGLEAGTTRQIAFYRGKNDLQKARGIIFSSLQVGIATSVLLTVIFFFISDFIAITFFHTPELSSILKIFCIATPFLVLIQVFTSSFRGFDRAQPRVYFQDLLRNALFPLLLIVVVLLHLPFVWVVYTFVATVIITFVAYATYTTKNLQFSFKAAYSVADMSITKELLLFSLPLLLVGMFQDILTWTDTLMLGYFKVPDDVGLYNVAVPLAHLLPIFLTAVNFLHIPIISQFYAKGQLEEIKRSYAVVTKWVTSATLPVFLTFVLFPEIVLKFFFGSGYVSAAFSLQILSVGFFISAALGPNGTTLTAIGQTRFLMWATITAAIANIILNAAMIPPLGINGAAIATALSLIIRESLISMRLYLSNRIHPFTKNYLKPVVASFAPALLIYGIARSLMDNITLWFLPIFLVSFLLIYGLSILLTRSFDKEDIAMLLTIEKRLGMNLAPVKRILQRFV